MSTDDQGVALAITLARIEAAHALLDATVTLARQAAALLDLKTPPAPAAIPIGTAHPPRDPRAPRPVTDQRE